MSERSKLKYHDLKTHPEPFAAVWAGLKLYEIRVNDRDYTVGDSLTLREWDPETESYTSLWMIASVRYMTHGGSWGLPANVCVMGIEVRDRMMGDSEANARLRKRIERLHGFDGDAL